MRSDSGGTRQLSYLDFELEIGLGSGLEYPVAVVRSPAGEARETMYFPYDERALESGLDKLQIALLRSGKKFRGPPSPEEQPVQNFGQALFNALLTGEVRSRYDVSLLKSAQQGKGLRLKLRIQPPELAALPWEFLYDSRQAEYVCLSRNTPLVRYLELPQPIQPLAVTPPLRILGMTASPRDLPSLDTVREKQRIEEAIKRLQANGLADLTWLAGETWRDLQKAMRGGPWHIFHFIGHGEFDRNTDEGVIALADEGSRTHRLNATQLVRLLADHRSLRLTLLNACEGARGSEHGIFSSTAATLVRRGIPAVLAMQYEITDQAAIEFVRAFYESLADGMPVDAAVAEARKAVSFAVANTVEWGVPVLYMRSPDGVLFRIQKPEAEVKQPKKAERPADKGANKERKNVISQLETPGDMVKPGSRLYIEREADRILKKHILRSGTTMLVKGSRQTGKSSLLVRGKQFATDHQRDVLYIHFRELDERLWQDLNTFFRRLADIIAYELKTESPDRCWRRPFGPKMKLGDFMEECVLAKAARPIVFIMDEVDKLFGSPCQDGFFSLLRVWHNKRAEDKLWDNLNLVLAYATEAHLFIKDMNQSPFNVGLLIEMTDFDLALIEEMNGRHGGLVSQEQDLQRLIGLVGGHPYLLHLAFYELATNKWTVDHLLAVALDEDGPFGSHLRGCLRHLRRQPELVEAMKEVVQQRACSDADAFYRLRTAGLIMMGHERRQVVPRCGLYEQYLERHL